MSTPSSLFPLLLLAACGGDKSAPPLDSGDDTAEDTDTDTAPPGTDDDGDGWTVEEGDCDDADIYVNPGWPRDDEDGKDNDCDGRVDEVWAGLTISYLRDAGDPSLITIDPLGRLVDELTVKGDCTPTWIDHGPAGGWVVNNAYAAVASVDEEGNCEDIAEWSEEERYAYGLAAHPDGYTVVSTLDSLKRVNADGSSEELAVWNADYTDPDNFEIAVYSVAVDLRDGTVGLFGYFGGFATYNASTGFVLHRAADLNNYDGFVIASGAAADGGGWYALGARTGWSVYVFDEEAADWSEVMALPASDWSPNLMSIDGDSGDWYTTANAGWYPSVWRIRDEDASVGTLYILDGSEPGSFYGVISNYD